MDYLIRISGMILPMVIVGVVAAGLWKKQDVYTLFIKGAEDGMRTVAGILPTLVGLMVAVGILRASGFLDFLAAVIAPFGKIICLPGEVVPFLLVKMFSSSAATGLALDLFASYGTDSYIGTLVSLAMASTETIFYTMSVYFLAVNVSKSRYTLFGALLSTFAGIAASVWIALAMQ